MALTVKKKSEGYSPLNPSNQLPEMPMTRVNPVLFKMPLMIDASRLPEREVIQDAMSDGTPIIVDAAGDIIELPQDGPEEKYLLSIADSKDAVKYLSMSRLSDVSTKNLTKREKEARRDMTLSSEYMEYVFDDPVLGRKHMERPLEREAGEPEPVKIDAPDMNCLWTKYIPVSLKGGDCLQRKTSTTKAFNAIKNVLVGPEAYPDEVGMKRFRAAAVCTHEGDRTRGPQTEREVLLAFAMTRPVKGGSVVIRANAKITSLAVLMGGANLVRDRAVCRITKKMYREICKNTRLNGLVGGTMITDEIFPNEKKENMSVWDIACDGHADLLRQSLPIEEIPIRVQKFCLPPNPGNKSKQNENYVITEDSIEGRGWSINFGTYKYVSDRGFAEDDQPFTVVPKSYYLDRVTHKGIDVPNRIYLPANRLTSKHKLGNDPTHNFGGTILIRTGGGGNPIFIGKKQRVQKVIVSSSIPDEIFLPWGN